MPRACVAIAWAVLWAGAAPLYAQQYTIATYAGGAPALPVSAISLAADRAGNLYILEFGDVRKVSPGGTITTMLAGGFISAATADSAGNLFVAGGLCDAVSCYDSIRRITGGGSILVAGGPSPGIFGPGKGDGGPASKAQLGFTSSLAVDAAGNIFLADLIDARIRKIDVNGIINTIGGDGVPGYSGDGGPATKATINYPFGLAADAAGNVYISDFNQAVRVLQPSAK